MLRIGVLARLGGVSVRRPRHYGDVGGIGSYVCVLRQTREMDELDNALLMQRLEPLVGRWTMGARVPGAAPEEPSGLCTFEWMLEGQFLLQRTEFSAPGPPEGVMIIGPDPEGENFTQHYFDSRGVARLYAMTFDRGTWVLQRDSSDFSSLAFRQRFVGGFSDDGASIEGRWERSDDGAVWELDFGLLYERAG
jgi:hypothetical protein